MNEVTLPVYYVDLGFVPSGIIMYSLHSKL